MNQQSLFEGKKSRDETFDTIRGQLSERERKWLERIESYGAEGCTADQLSVKHGQPQNQFSGRITKLVEKGLVKRTERRRPTRAGKKASVLVASIYQPEEGE